MFVGSEIKPSLIIVSLREQGLFIAHWFVRDCNPISWRVPLGTNVFVGSNRPIKSFVGIKLFVNARAS